MTEKEARLELNKISNQAMQELEKSERRSNFEFVMIMISIALVGTFMITMLVLNLLHKISDAAVVASLIIASIFECGLSVLVHKWFKISVKRVDKLQAEYEELIDKVYEQIIYEDIE